ncbi:MAG: acyltransferase family protein [Methanosarcina sp.]|nr:acyltransferase family protein [Methanosarcina sp.]
MKEVNLRLRWIDTLKGIAIILVVVGHLSIYDDLGLYIYSFHMPLFFFISGYLFNMKKYKDVPMKFLQNKAKTLLLPYLSFTAISYLFYITCDFLLRIYQPAFQIETMLGKGLFFNLNNIFFIQKELINTPLWFLVCLFTTETLFYFISKRFYKSKYNVFFYIVILSFVGYICSSYSSIRLPWELDIAFTAIVFYATGFYFHKYYDELFFKKGIHIFLILFIMNLLIGFQNQRVNMLGLVYNNYILFYLSAFSGILVYFYLDQKIGSFKILEYYGKNSLIILGMHYLIISILKYSLIFSQKILLLSIDQNIVFLLTLIGFFVLIVPIINIINKKFSFLLGQSDNTLLDVPDKPRSAPKVL